MKKFYVQFVGACFCALLAVEAFAQDVTILPTAPTSANAITLRYRTNIFGARFLRDSYKVSMTNNKIRVVLGDVSQVPTVDPGLAYFIDADIGQLPSGSYTIDLFRALSGQPDTAIVLNIPLTVADNRIVKALPYVQLNYADHWWNPAESGWGLFIWHDRLDRLLAAWFTYGSDNKAEWYTIQAGSWTLFNRYEGQIIKTTGPAFSAFVPGSAVQTQVVGTASISFTDANNGTFIYTLNGVTQTKNITRFKP